MKKVIVPGAGESKEVQCTGKSVMIVSSAIFSSLDEVPLISFNEPGRNLPIMPRNKFPYAECGYKQLIVTGTKASAGTEVYLLPLDVCVEPYINTDVFATTKRVCGKTFSKVATNVVQEFQEVDIVNQETGDKARSVYLSATGGAIVFAYDSNPDQAGFGHVLQPAGSAKATGSVEPTAVPVADETFTINLLGLEIEVTALAADTLQEISNKIRDALNNSAGFSAYFTASNNAGANVPVSITAKKAGEAFNGKEIAGTNADTKLSFVPIGGGIERKQTPIEMDGDDFIEKFRFIDAVAGTGAKLIVTPEF